MDAVALGVNRRTDDNPLVERYLGEGVRLELAVQRALADPQDLARLATIALRLAQSRLDRCPLHIRHCHAGTIHHAGLGRARLRLAWRDRANSRPGAHLDDLDARRPLLQAPPQLFNL